MRHVPKPVGAASAISSDAHFGHPALRSLDAALAFAILAALGQQRRSTGTGSPALHLAAAFGC